MIPLAVSSVVNNCTLQSYGGACDDLHGPRCHTAPAACTGKRRRLQQQTAATAPAAAQAPAELRAAIPVLAPPRRSTPDAQGLPEAAEGGDVFTEEDWRAVLRGYTSQFCEHEVWIDDSMVEGGWTFYARIPCMAWPIQLKYQARLLCDFSMHTFF